MPYIRLIRQRGIVAEHQWSKAMNVNADFSKRVVMHGDDID